MSVATPNNAPPLARTSSSEPLANTTLSEEQFLERETVRTRAALTDTLEDLKDSLRTATDVRLWTVQHPWAAVGAAAAAGFAAAAAFQSAVHPAPEAQAAANGATHAAAAANYPPQPGPQRASAITSGLFELAKVALQSAILAAGNAAASHGEHQPPPPPELPT